MAGDLIRRGCGRDGELQDGVAGEEFPSAGFTMDLEDCVCRKTSRRYVCEGPAMLRECLLQCSRSFDGLVEGLLIGRLAQSFPLSLLVCARGKVGSRSRQQLDECETPLRCELGASAGLRLHDDREVTGGLRREPHQPQSLFQI